MIKLAVFDLDGTLVDSLTDLALSVNKGLKKAGLPEHPIEKYNKFVGNGREMLIRRAIGEGCTEELFDSVIGTFDREYRLHCNDNTAAYDGCAEMLERLASGGIYTAVLSNKPDEFVKPDPEALHAMLALHGISPDECVYVGDSDVDVFTAQNSGVKMAGVSWGFRGREELLNAGAPFVADTADELAEYILSL